MSIPEKEIEQRLSRWKPLETKLPRLSKGYFRLYSKIARSADKGATW